MRKRLLSSDAAPKRKSSRMPSGETRPSTLQTMADLPPMTPGERAVATALRKALVLVRSLLEEGLKTSNLSTMSRLHRIALMVQDALGPIGEAIREIDDELKEGQS